MATCGRFCQSPNPSLSTVSSTGVGFALSYTPAIAMVGRYFSERKALAYGIGLSGSDIFTYVLLYFLVIHVLLSHPHFYVFFSLFLFPDFFHSFFSLLFACLLKFLYQCFFSTHSLHKSNFTLSSGSGIGTFILAPAVQLLIEHYSWRGALLVLGGFVSNLCVCGALMRPLQPRGGER